MNPNPEHARRFEGWLEAHRGILVKILRSFARTPADAADLQQEMLLQLWISVPAYAHQAKASTWVYRVCLNTALMWRRGTGRRERRQDDSVDLGEMPTAAASPAENVARDDLLEQLYAAILAMPEFDRALVLLLLDGLAYREIADVTGLTENHVGVALTRARKRLTTLMKGLTHELE